MHNVLNYRRGNEVAQLYLVGNSCRCTVFVSDPIPHHIESCQLTPSTVIACSSILNSQVHIAQQEEVINQHFHLIVHDISNKITTAKSRLFDIYVVYRFRVYHHTLIGTKDQLSS